MRVRAIASVSKHAGTAFAYAWALEWSCIAQRSRMVFASVVVVSCLPRAVGVISRGFGATRESIRIEATSAPTDSAASLVSSGRASMVGSRYRRPVSRMRIRFRVVGERSNTVTGIIADCRCTAWGSYVELPLFAARVLARQQADVAQRDARELGKARRTFPSPPRWAGCLR